MKNGISEIICLILLTTVVHTMPQATDNNNKEIPFAKRTATLES